MNAMNEKDVYKESLLYFQGDELAASIWMKKYALKDSDGNFLEKSPDDMHRRLAKEFARIETKYPNRLSEDEIYELFKKFKHIVPQGSPMFGIGNDQIVSLSNCFVIGDQKYDSYGSIMRIDEEQIQLMKRRGGVGHDLSHLRPSGADVRNSAITSSGPVSFMKRYSNSTREVGQDGRRGALMLSMSVSHPDVEGFIDAKLDKNEVTGANISVKMTDDFMKAVDNDTKYKHQYPIDSNDPTHIKEIEAKSLWDKIIHNAWESAEPGVLFWDTIIKESVPDCYADLGYKTVSTNPCFPASERLLTKDGYFKFGDLVNVDSTKNNNVVCDKRISYVDDADEKPENWKIDNEKHGTVIRKASNVFLTQKDAQIIELETSKGFKLRCTPDHHIATTIGMIEAKDLTPDNDILISIPDNNGTIINKKPNNELEILSLLFGLIQGDGTMDKKRKRLHFDFWGDDRERMKILVCELIDKLYDIFGERRNKRNRILSKYFISEINDKIRISSAWVGKIFEEHDFKFNNKFDIPEFIFNNSSNDIGKYYIAALLYCDGSIQGNMRSGYTIRLSQSNKEFLNKIQMILHSNGLIFGIYKRRDQKMTSLPNGKGSYSKYKTKEQFELISLGSGIVKYMSSIGFLGDLSKENKFNEKYNYQIKKSFTDTIVKISELDNEPVFCLKEDIGRNIIVNGISARRCGEIPLCPYDSCRLLAINLYGYVDDPFTVSAKFNEDKFIDHVTKAQRLMDDLIDLEIEKIDSIISKIKSDPEDEGIKSNELILWENIRKKAVEGRRTGLGITAEGDMLAALGYTYGTREATEFAVKIHQLLAVSAYKSSITLAQERGSFPIFSYMREQENPFIKRIMGVIEKTDPIFIDYCKRFGRRNISLLTIAPTGTTSIMTQTTSGLESAFLLSYKRRRKINANEKDPVVHFIDDVGDRWEEYNVVHHKFNIWLKKNGYNLDDIRSMNDDDLNEIIKKSPYYNATAEAVDWNEKIYMQGEIQKWVDHSISVTINLPKDTTEDTVSALYMNAWKYGCKGVTIYRDGSRSGVLVGNDDNDDQASDDDTFYKRPKTIECEIYKFQNAGESWIGFLGLKQGKPFEIFTGRHEAFPVPSNIKRGWISRVKYNGHDTRYDLKYYDKHGEEQIMTGLNRVFNKEYWNYAKLISSNFRHSMPIVKVYEMIESIQWSGDNITTWKAGVLRMIKKFIQNGTNRSEACPECKQDSLIYQDGCITCVNCGYSGCG